MATAWKAEPTITVRSPPMRSASAPHAWRATKAEASITDSMTALCVGLMPMSLQNATRCAEGIAMGMQQQEAGETDQRLDEVGMQAGDAIAAPGRRTRACGGARRDRRRLQQQGGRQDRDQHDHGVGQHDGLPAELGDAALEQRRPDDAGDVLAGRDQGDRRAAPAIEPAADIDQQRGIDAAIAEQARPSAPGRHRAPRSDPARTAPGRRPSCWRRWRRSRARRCGRPASPSGCRRRRCRPRPARRPAPAPIVRCPAPPASASCRPR